MKTTTRSPALLAAFVLLALSVAACDDDANGPVACTEEARAGIVVEVVNASTGAHIAEGATLTLREGEFVEVVTDDFGGETLAGVFEREGVYEVTVTRTSFVDWRREGVDVGLTPDECHVETVFLEARMEPVGVGEGA